MDSISIWQLLIIAVTIVLFFDTKKLNSIGPDPGASIKGFRKAMSDDKPKQGKTSQDVDFTAKTIIDKQAGTNQEQVRTEDAKRHDKEQMQSVFDISFSELLLVLIVGLVVLGPQRLPVTVKTIAGWIRTLRLLTTTVQSELTQGLKFQEFQNSLKRVEKASLTNLTPELRAPVGELRQVAESMKRSYIANNPEKVSGEAYTTRNPVMKDNETMHKGVTPAAVQTQASSPEQKPETTLKPVIKPVTDAESKTAAPSPSSNDKP